jgi:hypothetical protein
MRRSYTSSPPNASMEYSVTALALVSLFIPLGIFKIPYNITTLGRQLYSPSEGIPTTEFYRPQKSMSSAGFEPANLGSNG